MRLNSFKNAALGLALVATVSCGIEKATEEENVDNNSTVEQPIVLTAEENVQLESEYSSIPEGMMVKVPVDENGVELSEQSEMRSITSETISEDNADSAWSDAQVYVELDEDSSTESYTRGQNDRGQNRGQGRVQDRGQNRGQDRVQDRGQNRRQDRVQDRGQNRRQDRVQDRGQNRRQDRVQDRTQNRRQDRVQNRHQNRNQNRGHGRVQNRNQNRQHVQYRPLNRHNKKGHKYYRGHRNGRRHGYNNNYYTNHYRPSFFSSIFNWGYWSYNTKPRCYTRNGYKYYYYQKPRCNTASYCGNSSYGY